MSTAALGSPRPKAPPALARLRMVPHAPYSFQPPGAVPAAAQEPVVTSPQGAPVPSEMEEQDLFDAQQYKNRIVEVPDVEMVDAEAERLKKPVELRDVEKDDAPIPAEERYKAEHMVLNAHDCTINASLSNDPILLRSLPVGPDMKLQAAARMNVGIKSGRYLFEAEFLHLPPNSVARVGFSAGMRDDLITPSFCVTSHDGNAYFEGKVIHPPMFNPVPFQQGDVIGLLVNRTKEGHKNTISVLRNGQRVSTPQWMPPAWEKRTLFPYVSVTEGVVRCCRNQERPPSFKVRNFFEACKKDIGVSKIKHMDLSEVVCPIGDEKSVAEWVGDYVDELKDDANFCVLTTESMLQWQKQSLAPERPLSDLEFDTLHRMMTLRSRKYVYYFSRLLLRGDREQLLQRLGAVSKRIDLSDLLRPVAVFTNDLILTLPLNEPNAAQISLPLTTEGWDQVRLSGSQTEAQHVLNAYQLMVKARGKVEGFRGSSEVKFKLANWQKFRERIGKPPSSEEEEEEEPPPPVKPPESEKDEKKEPEEKQTKKKKKKKRKKEEEKKKKEEDEAERKRIRLEKEREIRRKIKEEEKDHVPPVLIDASFFTDEDWMLVELRVACHLVLHAFRTDMTNENNKRKVQDKPALALSMTPELFPFYYAEYMRAQGGPVLPVGSSPLAHPVFQPALYGYQTPQEIFEELIPDTVKVKEGLLEPQLKGGDCHVFNWVCDLTEEARKKRENKILAGNETAALKFTAPKTPALALSSANKKFAAGWQSAAIPGQGNFWAGQNPYKGYKGKKGKGKGFGLSQKGAGGFAGKGKGAGGGKFGQQPPTPKVIGATY